MSYKITKPDGTEILSAAETSIDLIDEHEIVSCIMAGCPDAAGYTLHNLTTGNVTKTEEVRARIDAAFEKEYLAESTEEDE